MQLQDIVRSDDPASSPETINQLRSWTGASKGTASATASAVGIDQPGDLGDRYRLIREFSEQLSETLEPEDCVVQTMPEASPVKWHLATRASENRPSTKAPWISCTSLSAKM